MIKHESMRLVTFTTEESMEESKKSTEESKNRWRNNGGRKQEHQCSELQNMLSSGSRRKKGTAGIYRWDLQSRLVAPTGTKGNFLVPGHATSREYTFTPGWIHKPGVKVYLQSQSRLEPPTGTKGISSPRGKKFWDYSPFWPRIKGLFSTSVLCPQPQQQAPTLCNTAIYF